MSMLALDKWARLIRIIAQHGGPFGALSKLWRMDTLKQRATTGYCRQVVMFALLCSGGRVWVLVKSQAHETCYVSCACDSPSRAQHSAAWVAEVTTLHEEGKYMGRDCFGNRYFENKNYMIGRSRWVEYNPQFKWEYDASQVTPEWFGWLHYKTDRLPCEDWAKYCLNCCCWCHCWLQPHQENLSGTEFAYYPYSTTRAKILVWDGLSICNRPCYSLQC